MDTFSDMSGAEIFLAILGVLFIIAIILCLATLPARIAEKKGYGFTGFFLFSLFLFFPALIVALCLKSSSQIEEEIRSAVSSAHISLETNIAEQISILSELRIKGVIGIAEQLSTLSELRNSGAISEAEFQIAKNILLQEDD